MYDIRNAEILKTYGEELISYCQKRFGFKNPPNLFYVTDEENYHKLFGKTAYYDPEKQNIAIYIKGRHPKDILRSLAHELVHHTQNENGELFSGETLGPGYAQNNSHMRSCEERAYKDGNMAFRDWEDEKKIKFKGEQIMIENNLKEAIKLIVESKLKKMRETSSVAAGTVEGFAGGVIKEPVEEVDEFGAAPDFPEGPMGEDDSAEDRELMGEEDRDQLEEGEECPGCDDPDCSCNQQSESDSGGLEESKIITPEQEQSFHSRLFGTRLVALNAKLMSNFIKKK